MPQLHVLGAISLLTANGEEARSVTAQPKRAALLAYLAFASRDGPVRRDTVLALFWPELDTAHARHALRQALYHLRQALGPTILQVNGDDEVRIRLDALRCDVCEFRDAVASRSFARALEFYQGDLLPGLYVAGAAEFGEWLEETRAQLRGQALDAAAALSLEAEHEGRRTDAARWAQRAHLLAPYDEPVLRRLLEVLDAGGDGSTAVLAFEAFAARCRRELGVAPSAETQAVIDRIRARRPQRRPPRRTNDVEPAADGAGAAPASPRRRPLRWPALAFGAVVLAGASGAWWVSSTPAPRLDPELLAIPPFRVVAPAADSLVLSEGIADLLSIALQSLATPRVVNPRVTSVRWRARVRGGDESEQPDLGRELARSLGAGLLLSGSAFLSEGDEIIITATLQDVHTGAVRGTSTVRGPAAELMHHVDRLATGTLTTVLREDPHRLERLTSTSYAAVRAYLTGRAAMRRGEYGVALRQLELALELDSTFAAAALAAVDVAGWSGLAGLGRFESLAYRHRERLTPRDTAHLRAWIGYQAYTGRSTSRDLFDATEAAARVGHDQPETLYLLGDRYFHIGVYLQLGNSARRSRELFERALAVDSGFIPAREHLVELAVATGDARAARRYRDKAVASEPTALRTPFQRWLAAAFLQDTRERRRIRAALDTMNPVALRQIVNSAQELGTGVDDAEDAARALMAHAATANETSRAAALAEALYYNLGRPAAAERVRPPEAIGPATPSARLLRIAQLAWFADTEPSTAPAALAELRRRAALAPRNDEERQAQEPVVSASLLWRLWRGDTTGTAVEALRLRASLRGRWPETAPQLAREVRLASVLMLLEHHRLPRHGTITRPYLEQLDSLARVGAGEAFVANALLVRIFSELGDAPRALAAARRRLRGVGTSAWLAPTLLHEARLAARTGDAAGAATAYRHYLALRFDPEPRLRPLADSARAEYRRLDR